MEDACPEGRALYEPSTVKYGGQYVAPNAPAAPSAPAAPAKTGSLKYFTTELGMKTV